MAIILFLRVPEFYRNGPKGEENPPVNHALQGQPRKVSLHHLAAQVCPVLRKVRLQFRQEVATEGASLILLEGSMDISLRKL